MVSCLGILGGQECSAKSLGPVPPIQRWGNVSFRNRRSCLCHCVCLGASSGI